MNPPDLAHLTYELKSHVGLVTDRLFQTEDQREGVASFLEKRAPQFKGR